MSGDEGLLDAFPHRFDAGPGRLIERNSAGLALRLIDLERHLDDPYGELPPTWQLTPDGRFAVVSRANGTFDWPVVDLDTDTVVNRIEGRGASEPRLAFSPGGDAWVGVFDELHRVDLPDGQLTNGVRLKNDNSGSNIDSLRYGSDSALLVTWFGWTESEIMKGVKTPADLRKVVRLDPGGVARSGAEMYGAIGRLEPDGPKVPAVAWFPGWVQDPALFGDDVLAVQWAGPHGVLRSRFQESDWPMHQARPDGEIIWF